MKLLTKAFSLLFILFAFTACAFSEYKDISQNYKTIIGAQYKFNTDMFIYGITLDKNYKKVIDYYTVETVSGISGPEVISLETISKGIIFEVVNIKKCTNCFTESNKIVIKFKSIRLYNDKPVVVSREATVSNIINSFDRL